MEADGADFTLFAFRPQRALLVWSCGPRVTQLVWRADPFYPILRNDMIIMIGTY